REAVAGAEVALAVLDVERHDAAVVGVVLGERHVLERERSVGAERVERESAVPRERLAGLGRAAEGVLVPLAAPGREVAEVDAQRPEGRREGRRGGAIDEPERG